MTLAITIVLSALLSLFYQPQALPFAVFPDTASAPKYSKLGEITRVDQAGTVYYSEKTIKLLDSMHSKLVNFRCSESFIRTVQGVYFIENGVTQFMERKRIKNFEFLEHMRNKDGELPKGTRVLSGRICETDHGTMIVMYSIGKYDTKAADSQPPRQVVLNSSDNLAIIEIISSNLSIKSRQLSLLNSTNHARCDRIFGLTNQTLYLLCEEKADFASQFTVTTIDLKSGLHKTFETCTNIYDAKIESECVSDTQ